MTKKITLFSSNSALGLKEKMDSFFNANPGIYPGLKFQGWTAERDGTHVLFFIYENQDRSVVERSVNKHINFF